MFHYSFLSIILNLKSELLIKTFLLWGRNYIKYVLPVKKIGSVDNSTVLIEFLVLEMRSGIVPIATE